MLISFNFIKIAWGSPHFEIFQPYPKVWYYDMHVDFFHVHWLKMVEIGQTSQLLICGCCKFKLSIGLLICNRMCCRSDQVWLVVSSFKYVFPIRVDDPSLKKTPFFSGGSTKKSSTRPADEVDEWGVGGGWKQQQAQGNGAMGCSGLPLKFESRSSWFKSFPCSEIFPRHGIGQKEVQLDIDFGSRGCFLHANVESTWRESSSLTCVFHLNTTVTKIDFPVRIYCTRFLALAFPDLHHVTTFDYTFGSPLGYWAKRIGNQSHGFFRNTERVISPSCQLPELVRGFQPSIFNSSGMKMIPNK